MKRLTSLACLSLALLLLGSVAVAAEASRDLSSYNVADGKYSGVVTGLPVDAGKARADTFYLMGGPTAFPYPVGNPGNFQDGTGTQPLEQGWTGVDLTQPITTHWNVNTFNAELLDPLYVPNHAIWCGEEFTASPCADQFGYGNNYNDYLDWYGTVTDNTVATNVSLTARLNYDNEPGYDFLYLLVDKATGMTEIQNWNGTNKTAGVFVPVDVSVSTSVGPADYVGPSNNQVHLRWRATADGAWSDADGLWCTDGHTQLDNIRVFFNGIQQGPTADFEGAKNNGGWTVAFPDGVGDFSKVWPRLNDVDVCNSNATPQFAFIDDGLVVPGTGGTQGQTWTYGPGGYVHNLLGGLAGPDFHMNNEIWSPVLTWQGGAAGGYDGAFYAFDVYRHLPITNGLFYVWGVRSSADGGITWGGWTDRNFVYYSNAGDYLRVTDNCTDLMEPGRTHVQVNLGAYELGWAWGYTGTDGTPAPYFDNVSFRVFPYPGPGISSREIDLANDNFPAIGTIDPAIPGNNYVRFDMARNISLAAHLRNDPGDSIYADIVSVRFGTTLVGTGEMVYKLKRNTLFDPYRDSGLPDEGSIPGQITYTGTGTVVADRYNFDLPDGPAEGGRFLFPGDILHYYIKGTDSGGGISTLPGNIAGFGVFPGDADYVPYLYPATYIVRALPKITAFNAPNWEQPAILWWNDFDTRGGENEILGALYQLGYQEGVEFDAYYTNGPSSGVGNGLGGRATSAQLAGYQTLLYTTGDLGTYTLANGDYTKDPSFDIAVVDAWLRGGGKNAFFCGDDLAFDLNRSGASAVSFINTWLGVIYNGNDVRSLIGNQSTPLVKPVPGNPVNANLAEHIAYGGCGIINDFDAVTATGAASRIMRFTDPTGTPAYTYAAMVYNPVALYNAEVIYAPYDLMYVYTPDTQSDPLPARARLLNQILVFFGHIGTSPQVDVPEAPLALAVKNFPNPFNPKTTISYTMPQAGHLSIKIYNLRGELVRTLIDGDVEAGNNVPVEWDGTSDGGQAVASGVYFYQTNALGKSLMNKMTVVK